MQVHGAFVLRGKRKHRLKHFPVVRRELGRKFGDLLQRYGAAAKQAPRKVFACVERNAYEPGFFMFLACKEAE